MSNKQLAVLIAAIFLAVLLAYQLFVGFDLRSGSEKYWQGVASNEANKAEKASCAQLEAAGGHCVD